MSCAVCTAVVTIALIVLGVKLKKFWDKFWYIPPIPQLQEKWWGSGEAKTVDETIKPFKISISQEVHKSNINYKFLYVIIIKTCR